MLRPAPNELERIHAILERVGIAERLYARTDTLSGGEQQRVAIARALYQDPLVLLADEPVASVDPARARETVRLLREIATESGATLVVSLHDLVLAREFFPRILGLRAGRIRLQGESAALTDTQFEELYRLDEEEAACSPRTSPGG
jgi:phosphonate transport system ATP-binding protein